MLTQNYTTRCPETGEKLWASFMVQCRQDPQAAKTQSETMNFAEKLGPDHRVCRHVGMDVIECTTAATGSIIPTGLLVRVWRDGSEPDIHNPQHYRSPVDTKRTP